MLLLLLVQSTQLWKGSQWVISHLSYIHPLFLTPPFFIKKISEQVHTPSRKPSQWKRVCVVKPSLALLREEDHRVLLAHPSKGGCMIFPQLSLADYPLSHTPNIGLVVTFPRISSTYISHSTTWLSWEEWCYQLPKSSSNFNITGHKILKLVVCVWQFSIFNITSKFLFAFLWIISISFYGRTLQETVRELLQDYLTGA